MHLRLDNPFLLGITLGVLVFVFILGMNTASAEGGDVACRGDDVTITATLLQNGTYGDPVPNQRVHFFDQTHNLFLGSSLTNSDGQAAIEWLISANQPLGVTTINATFLGNQSLALNPSCQWMFITILSPTIISTQVDKYTLASGDLLNFTTVVLSDGGEVLQNAHVTVSCNALQLQSGFTDTSGRIRFAIECNATWSELGVNQIRVAHERDMFAFSEAAETQFNISIDQIPSSLELMNSQPGSIQLNSTLHSYILLKANGLALSGVNLDLLLDGAPLARISTNESGVASIHTNIDSRFSLGSHLLTIRYPGTSRYATCSLGAQMTVVSVSLVRVTLPEFMVIGMQADIRVEVCDSLGRPLIGGMLTLHDLVTGQSIGQTIVPNAVALNLELQVTGKRGVRDFQLDILGNQYIVNTSCRFGAVIWACPKFDIVHADIMGYAYPGQEFLMEIHLGDSECNYTSTTVEIHAGNTSVIHLITNQSGIIVIHLTAPKASGELVLSLTYGGNSSAYRLGATTSYVVIVTETMPSAIELYDYQIVSPLQQLRVRLLLQALNGSLLMGIVVNYEWLATRGAVMTGKGGIAELYLQIPNQPGSFNLSYWIEPSHFLLYSAGYAIISLTPLEFSSIEGIGIVGLAMGVCISIAVVGVPAIRRRYLLD